MSVKALFDLSGKAALVTGGSRGLGLQMAEALGEMGARVAITARKQPELDEAAARLRGIGVESRRSRVPASSSPASERAPPPIAATSRRSGTMNEKSSAPR